LSLVCSPRNGSEEVSQFKTEDPERRKRRKKNLGLAGGTSGRIRPSEKRRGIAYGLLNREYLGNDRSLVVQKKTGKTLELGLTVRKKEQGIPRTLPLPGGET